MESSNLSKVAKGGLLFAGGSLTASFAQILFGVMIIRIMPAEEFGAVSLASTLITILVTLSVLGLQNGLPRFVSLHLKAREKHIVSALAGNSIFIVATVSLSLSVLLVAMREVMGRIFGIQLLSEILLYMSFMITPLALMMVFNSIFRGTGNTKAKVVYQDLSLNVIKLALLVILGYTLSYRLENILWIYVGSALIAFMFYVLYLKRRFVDEFKISLDYRLSKKIVWFSLPLLGMALSTNIVNWAGILGLGYLGEADEVAFFAAAQRAAQLVTIPLLATGFIFLPVATGLIGEENKEKLQSLYQGVTKWITMAVVPMIVYLFADSSFFLVALFGEPYRHIGPVLNVLVLASFIHVLMGPNAMTAVAFGNTRIVFIAAIIASLLSVIGCALFIPVYGVFGAASSIAIAQVASNLYISWNLHRSYSIHVVHKQFIKPVLTAVILTALVMFLVSAYRPFGALSYVSMVPVLFALSFMSPFLSRSLTADDYEILTNIKRRFGR